MAYIYIIKNDINNKVYIGKTIFSLAKRWKEHLHDSQSQRQEKRPLYNAISKYGAEHFWIELLEECLNEDAENKEQYWINFYNSYYDGYNATLGGDGKQYLDYKKILKLYDTTNLTSTDIAKLCNCERTQVRNIIFQYRDIEKAKQSFKERTKRKQIAFQGQKVYCLELNLYFDSMGEAGSYMFNLGKGTSLNAAKKAVRGACAGTTKTAYGYHWEKV